MMVVPTTFRCRSSCILLGSLFSWILNLCFGSCHGDGGGVGDIFVPVDPGDVYWQTEIPFDLPRFRRRGGSAARQATDEIKLSSPDFIEVFDFAGPLTDESSSFSSANQQGDSGACSDEGGDKQCTSSIGETQMPSLLDIGAAVRRIVDSALASNSSSSGVLFRNIHRIKAADDFAEFWRGCTTSGIAKEKEGGWTPTELIPFRSTSGRPKISEIDIVYSPTFKPANVHTLHNEQVYNPNPISKFALFCLQDAAWGGESLLARNTAVTERIPNDILDYVKEHGGVRYRRVFQHRDQLQIRNTTGTSWQSLCGVETQNEAIECFKERHGFDEASFDGQGNVIVIHTLPGFRRDPQTKTDVWFNELNSVNFPSPKNLVTLGDGTSLPMNMIRQLQRSHWKASTVVKLNPGDFLLVNNLEVMHGRLPFGNSEEKTRMLLSVYTV